MTQPIVIGIDVGAHTLVASLGNQQNPRSFSATAQGRTALVQWVQHHQGSLVVLEATGGYHVALWEALDGAGIAVAVCHPNRVRDWMKGQGQRAKTDGIDARLLARYGQQEQPTPTPLPSLTRRTIAALVDRRGQLVKLRTAERNRCKQAMEPLKPAIVEHIAMLNTMIRAIERACQTQLQTDPELAALVARLRTVPGIALLTAVRLAVELPELGQVSSKRLAALVGVAPFDRQSGTSRARSHIAGGRSGLRHGLYQPVVTTIRCDPTFHAHYEQLTNRGKSTNEARIACMRRLLGILNLMVREELTWQETNVGQGVFLRVAA